MVVKTQNRTLLKNNIWQKLWRSTNTYDTLIPLYKACKILGLAPYCFREIDGRYKYVSSKLDILYSIIFVLSYIGKY